MRQVTPSLKSAAQSSIFMSHSKNIERNTNHISCHTVKLQEASPICSNCHTSTEGTVIALLRLTRATLALWRTSFEYVAATLAHLIQRLIDASLAAGDMLMALGNLSFELDGRLALLLS
jgi:hypothetical protein